MCMLGIELTVVVLLQVPPPTLTEEGIRKGQEWVAAGSPLGEQHEYTPAAKKELPVPPEWQAEQAWNRGPECGPNALYLFCNLIGRGVTLDQVRALAVPDPKKGTTLAQLSAACTELGIENEIRFVGGRDVDKLPLPCIAHFMRSGDDREPGHYVVVFAENKGVDKIGVIDGTSGIYFFMPRQLFVRSFSGYVLVSPRRWLVAAATLLKITAVGLGALIVGMVMAGKWKSIRRGSSAESAPEVSMCIGRY